MKLPHHWDGHKATIVFRLRLTFAFIIFLLGFSSLLGGYLLFKLRDSQLQSIKYSVPALAEAHKLESHLTNIADFTIRIRNEYSKDRVIKLASSLHEKKDQLSRFIETIFLTSKIEDTAVGKLQESLGQLKTSVDEIIPYKLQTIKMNESIEAKMSRLIEIRTLFSDLIEPLSLDLATALNDTFTFFSANSSFPVFSSADVLERNFNDQHQLLEISYRMSSLLDTVEQLSPANEEQAHTTIVSRLNTDIHRITQILVNLDDLDSRSKLAKMIKEIRSLTTGADGLLSNIETYQTNETKFNVAHNEQLNIVSDVSNILDTVVAGTKRDIELSTSNFDKILKNILIMLVVFGISFLGIIYLVNVYVVERQINQRMLKLTSAVTDIAKGNTNREVDVFGSDEIGTMAVALEVFKENAKELLRSNDELEQFAYAASHDLKSPLRAIESLAQWTLEDAGDELSAESKSNLEQLLSRAHRLSKLQTDLLEYSQAGKAEDSVDILNMDKIVNQLTDLLDPDKHFTIKSSYPPEELMIHITPFRQIILNLINNAVKHHDNSTGNIHIKTKIRNGRLIVSVSDDGPGIAVKYQERIFGLFEKLESKDTVEGSGLGLSLVKKMVEQYKGSISVISNPDKKRGSTFVFDWPIVEILSDQRKVAGF